MWNKRVNEKEMRKDLKKSLEELKTDYIDIYMLHRDDPDTDVAVAVETFNAMHEEGNIGAFGASNWTHTRIEEANEYAYKHNLIPFSVSSPNFCLARQIEDPWGGGCVNISGPENQEARAWYEKNQMPVIAYASLGRGFFSGRMKSEYADHASDYLDSFAGIVIAVSHDRYFLDNIVDRIFAFEGEGRLTQYEGGYTDYAQAVNKKGAVSDMQGGKSATDSEEDKNRKKASQADWKQNRPQKLKFSYKEQREFETIDDEIAALEEKLEKLDKDMEANATNSMKLREIMEEKENAQQKLDEKMDRWVYLNDLAERIQAQKV